MQRIYRAATLFRLFVRKFLAVSAVTLWVTGACSLVEHRQLPGVGLLSAILATLAAIAWRFLLFLEQQHVETLAKHRVAAPVAAAKPEKPVAYTDAAPGLVAQAG
jgi:hypothetical protein